LDDLLQEFLAETAESMDQLDGELVRLERFPDDPELLKKVFRTVHTIKGTCGFLALPRLERVAHAAENTLGQIRDGSLPAASDTISLVLESLDRIKEILAALERTQAEPEGDDAELIERLDRLDAAAAVDTDEDDPSCSVAFHTVSDFVDFEVPGKVTLVTRDDPEPVEPANAALPVTPAEPLAAAVEASQPLPPARPSVRVKVDLLDSLMTIASDLVLTRNQLLQKQQDRSDGHLKDTLQRLSQVTTELQENVIKTRMQPVGDAWAPIPRLVRDLARDLNKKIDLTMEGEETELDRQMLELIRDPLTHMVRNSADHGLETPEQRRAMGKPETGTIALKAYHQGGQIVIEISDDGAGLDTQRIRSKALANGLIREEVLNEMSENQIHQFIFHAGFSTAADVTAVSGRGVGMDVVRSNIGKIGGTIDLRVVQGEGTTFTMTIPLTLAIIRALIVGCGGERFALPEINVVEVVRIGAKHEKSVEFIRETPVLRLRERLLPLVSLRGALGIVDDAAELETQFIIVTQAGGHRYGIIVDAVFDTEEIVVKPIAPVLRMLGVFSGNTILGDGNVITILEPNALAVDDFQAGSDEARAIGTTGNGSDSGHVLEDRNREMIVVFRAGEAALKAVPLSCVAGIEDIATKNVEVADGRYLMQYRGGLLPLVAIGQDIETSSAERRHVLILSDGSRTMGLVVDGIVDIVEDDLQIALESARPDIAGSTIVAGNAMELVDVEHYLRLAHGVATGMEALPSVVPGRRMRPMNGQSEPGQTSNANWVAGRIR
jgi:two-component system chemotaxis sensor kinase CheA